MVPKEESAFGKLSWAFKALELLFPSRLSDGLMKSYPYFEVVGASVLDLNAGEGPRSNSAIPFRHLNCQGWFRLSRFE